MLNSFPNLLILTLSHDCPRGSFIEKGAVSVSVVRGVLSKERAAAMSARCVWH